MTAVEDFKAGLRGQLLRPGDDAYEEARKLWNGMFDRRPAMIVRCAGAADVISAVNFARDNRLQAAVRGGGHSFPGHSVCEGGLVIDLSPMKAIRVDPAARTARAQPGVKWIEFDIGPHMKVARASLRIRSDQLPAIFDVQADRPVIGMIHPGVGRKEQAA